MDGNTKLKFSVAGLVGLFVLFIVAALPTAQAMFYFVFVETPAFWYWLLVGSALTFALALYKPKVTLPVIERETNLVAAAIVVTLAMAIIVGPLVSGIYAYEDRANTLQSDAEQLDSLPDTSDEHIRVLPRSVADVYASSSVQDAQYSLSESDLTKVNGSYSWSYARVPDNPMVTIFGNQRGSMYVNMEQIGKNATVEETAFSNGRGQLFTDSHAYRSVLNSPLKHHKWNTRFNSQHNGESFIAHSTTTHKWKFRLAPIPQVYAVPQQGPVNVMKPDGTINSYSPEEATEVPKFSGENYYPYSLAMFNVESMKYRHGTLNKWFFQKDLLEVPDLSQSSNSWPLVVPTMENNETNLTYFVGAEPARGGSGLFEVWTFNGQTGDVGVQRYDETQDGPNRAIDAVSQRPEVSRLSSANVVSPVPIVKNGQLYWHTKVIPESESGVTYTAFVNADNRDVTLVKDTKGVYAFMTEEEVEEVENTPTDGPTTTVTVAVTDENGDITRTQNITVPQNGTVDISIDNTNNETNTD